MKRREFIGLLGGAAVWSFSTHAQQPMMPTIGFLRSTPAAPFAHLIPALRDGLNENGFVEGQNVIVEYRYADNQLDRLPAMAAELVQSGVAAIVANGFAAEAAKAATTSIPVVFVTGDDPVKRGLVASLHRPGGNLTGVTFFGAGELNAKRMELLLELTTLPAKIAVLIDPNFPGFDTGLAEVKAAAVAAGREVMIVSATSTQEIALAFNEVTRAGAGALLVSGSPVFNSQRSQLIALTALHSIPAIYDQRDYVVDGGLISYAASFTGAYRQAGAYVGRILKGAKPSELPVLQPTKFELVINLKTAKALGVEVPPTLLVRAEEVIE